MRITTLERIYKSGLKFLVPLSLKETYDIILREAMRLVSADSGAIYLKIDDGFKATHSSLKRFYTLKPRKRGNIYKAFNTNQPIIVDFSAFGPAHHELSNLGIKSGIFVPLSNHGKAIGVLALHSNRKEYFDKDELTILKLFGSMANLAIRKSQLYNETKNALEARDLFISMAAHEFRTPLTTITGYSQLLYSKLSGTNTPESKWVSQLTWETSRLTQLVNELLEVERIQRGQFQYTFKECRLTEVINRAISDFRFIHPDHQITFENQVADDKDVIIGDFNKLIQLMTNLLDNAAKFSSDKTQIAIILKSKCRSAYIAIKDKGRGIPKQDLPDIFEKYYKSIDHTKEGMGLGLFLAKNIVAQHHGNIHIRSKEKKGTKVEINLPKINYG